MRANSQFLLGIICLAFLGLFSCVAGNNPGSTPAGAAGMSARAVTTIDETATAASAIIEAALATTPLPPTNVTSTPLIDIDATKTVEAQAPATAIAATLAAQPSNTPTADLAATQTTEAQRVATAIAATLTAQPTPTPTATPTPNLDATQTAIAEGVATSVAATLTARPPPTPDATETEIAIQRAIMLTLTAQPTPTPRPPGFSERNRLRIAFAYGDVGDSDLRVADVETGSVYAIARQACDEAEPSWSPDNTQIIYHADCAESYDIYRVNSDGTANVRLTFTSDTDEREPEYSPDGSQIIYRVNPRKETKTNAVGELWIMNANSDGQHSLGVIGRAPIWSPDGQRIAFMSDRTSRWDIYIYDLTSGSITQLTNCDTNCRWPAWSPDGQTIIFNTTTRPTNTEPDALWIIPAVGGSATRISFGRTAGRPSWSSTGLIAFSSDEGIEYMRSNGSERRVLIADKLNWAPHWSK